VNLDPRTGSGCPLDGHECGTCGGLYCRVPRRHRGNPDVPCTNAEHHAHAAGGGYQPGCPTARERRAAPKLVGLAGRAGSGKSTCAAWLVEHRQAVEFSLAEPLKLLAMDVFGFSREQVFGTQKDKETVDLCVSVRDEQLAQSVLDAVPDAGYLRESKRREVYAGRRVSPREMLIRLGNGARERIYKDVWLDACLARIRERAAPLSVVADVRYDSEAAALHKAGAKIIRLNCPDAATAVDRNASSEKSVDEIDPQWLVADLTIERSPGAVKLIETFKSTFEEIEKGWAAR